jgi:hypothetical protein
LCIGSNVFSAGFVAAPYIRIDDVIEIDDVFDIDDVIDYIDVIDVDQLFTNSLEPHKCFSQKPTAYQNCNQS